MREIRLLMGGLMAVTLVAAAPGAPVSASNDPAMGVLTQARSTLTVSSTGAKTTHTALTSAFLVGVQRCVKVTVSGRIVASVPNTTADIAIDYDNEVVSPQVVGAWSSPILLAGGPGGTSFLLVAYLLVDSSYDADPSPDPHQFLYSIRRTAGTGTVYFEQAAGLDRWSLVEDIGAHC